MNKNYRVLVDDNFDFMDEDSRVVHGSFPTYEEALTAAKGIVDRFLEREASKYASAEDLNDAYQSFGDDPFIVPTGGAPDPEERFSAWKYAEQRAKEMMRVDDLESDG